MNIDEHYKTPTLTKEDFPTEARMRIDLVDPREFTDKETGVVEKRVCVFFNASDKPVDLAKALVLNATNKDVLRKLFGPETDEWIGKSVTLYSDPSVMFGGRRVGGIRVREMDPVAPKPKPAPQHSPGHQARRPAPAQAPAPANEPIDDSIPF
jgi:hypothetical protein